MGNHNGSSFAVCQLGIKLGHDADEVRANRLTDGRVGCIFCGVNGPSIFEELQNVNQSLGLPLHMVAHTEPQRRYGFGFHYNHVVWGEIRFDAAADFDGDNVLTDFGDEYRSPKPEAKLPAAVDNLALMLTRYGFRVVLDQANNSFGHLTFTRKAVRADQRNSNPTEVTVAIHWAY